MVFYVPSLAPASPVVTAIQYVTPSNGSIRWKIYPHCQKLRHGPMVLIGKLLAKKIREK